MRTVSNSGYAPYMRKPPPKPASGGTQRRQPPTRRRAYPNQIHALTRAKKVTYAALGDLVGAHEVTIANLASGKQKLTQDWMNRLAEALGVGPGELISEAAGSGLRRVRVRGALKAGEWSEGHEWPEDDQYDVMIPDEPAFMHMDLYAGEIEGHSMNLRYPPGSAVVLALVGQRPGEIEVGKRYHVRRTRSDGLVEDTIKTLVKDDNGRFWLKPESSQPEHQEWISLDSQPGSTVELVGRVKFVVHRED